MKKLLIIAPLGKTSAPRQEIIIKQRLIKDGYKVGSLTNKNTGFKRLLDIITNGIHLIHKNDVVLINVFGGRAFIYESISIIYGRMFNKHVVTLLRGGWIPEYYNKYKFIYKNILNMANSIVVPSNYLFDELTAMGQRIDYVVPNFIELKDYQFRLRSKIRPKILYMRGIHKIYNPEMAIKAFSLIQNKYPKASITIAGKIADLSQLKKLKKMIKILNVKNISIIGMIKKKKISELVMKHDIYIQTNRVENMPVSVLEMWACGIPIVATNVGGITHLLNNEYDALIVESEDYKTMAKECMRLIKNQELVKKLSINGSEKVKIFTWENIEKQWKKILFVK